MRTALCTASRVNAVLSSCRSCERPKVPQPLIADTAGPAARSPPWGDCRAADDVHPQARRKLAYRILHQVQGSDSRRCHGHYGGGGRAPRSRAGVEVVAPRALHVARESGVARGGAAASATAQICRSVRPGAPAGVSTVPRVQLQIARVARQRPRECLPECSPQAALSVVFALLASLQGAQLIGLQASSTRHTSSGCGPR